jgi:hypothetical protein
MFPQSGGFEFSLSHCEIEGRNFTGTLVTRCVGSDVGSPTAGPSLIEYCKVTDWPSDFLSGFRGVDGHETIIRGNYIRITGAQGSEGLHPDGIQISQLHLGDGLTITGNVIDIRPLAGSEDFSTAPIAFSNGGDFLADVTVEDNDLCGGSHSIYVDGSGSGATTGAMSVSRLYVSDYVNGILYAGSEVMESLTMNNIKSATNGAAMTFSYNNGVTTETVSSIP